MTKFGFILAYLFTFSKFSAPETGTLHVTVGNVAGKSGNLLVAIYDSEKNFLKVKKQTKVMPASASGGVTFSDLEPGTYAIAIVHDANSNGKFDSNFFGMPTEGFGFSNDARGVMGPPSFKKASFTIEESSKSIQVNLRYLF